MAEALTLDIAANTRDFIKGTDDVADALEQVSDALDVVGKDGDDSAEKLEKSFSDAQREITREAKRIGDNVGDNVRRGTKRAGDGLDEMKDEAKGTAREVAASFDGSAESIAGGFQEVAANAFAGFGPAGVAAGLVAAGGIGLVTAELQKQQEAADEVKRRFASAYQAAAEAGRAFLDEQQIQSAVADAYFNPDNADALKQARKDAAALGVELNTVLRAQAGDQDAINDLLGKARDLEAERSAITKDYVGLRVGPEQGAALKATAEAEALVERLEQQKKLQDENQRKAEEYLGTSAAAREEIQKQNKALADRPSTLPVKAVLDDSDITGKLTRSRSLRVDLELFTATGRRVV